jgi:ankyrin repeat protein
MVAKKSLEQNSKPYKTEKNDVDSEILQIFPKGMDPNTLFLSGQTSLIIAAKSGQTSTAKFLINAGANTKARDKNNRTALTYAAEQGYVDIVTFLIHAEEKSGILDCQSDSSIVEACVYAVKTSRIEIVNLFFNAGVNVNELIKGGRSFLSIAVQKANLEVIKYLLDAGANLEHRDFTDKTIFMSAVSRGNLEIVDQLLFYGADVNAQSFYGRTALMYAAYKGNTILVERLIEVGARLNDQTQSGYTALDYAKFGGKNWRNFRRISKTIRKTGGVAGSGPKLKRGIFRFILNIKQLDTFDEFTAKVWLEDLAIHWCIVNFFLGMGIVASFVNDNRTFISGVLVFSVLIALPFVFQFFPSMLILILNKFSSIKTEPLPDPGVNDRQAKAQLFELDHIASFLSMGTRELREISQRFEKTEEKNIWQLIRRSRLKSAGLGLLFLLVYLLFLFNFGYCIRAVGVTWVAVVFLIAYPVFSGFLLWPYHKTEVRLRRSRLEIIQQGMDKKARMISRIIEISERENKKIDENFGLYLRAFSTTDRLPVNGIDLETSIAYSISHLLTFVALGQPGEHIGAGRIETEDFRWRNMAEDLIRNASIVLMIPSGRPGTIWEIRFLKENNFLEKTIFMMPPEMPFIGRRYSFEWQEAVSRLKELGIILPPHYSKGLLFRLNSEGRIDSYAPFGIEHFIPPQLEYDFFWWKIQKERKITEKNEDQEDEEDELELAEKELYARGSDNGDDDDDDDDGDDGDYDYDYD